MKVEFWAIGKTREAWLREGVEVYCKRLRRYLPFGMVEIPDVKGGGKLAERELVRREGEALLGRLKPADRLVLLDERGTSRSSESLARHLERLLQGGDNRLVFAAGGAYGFSTKVQQRANEKLSLSKMTLSHQLVRLFFCEQLYRAMTILRGEPYHHGKINA